MKIATKLTLTIFSLALLLIVVAGFSIYTLTLSVLEKYVSENQLGIANETMARVDRVMYERYLDIQDFANSIIFEKFILGTAQKDEVNQRLKSFFETSGPWDLVKIVGKDGNVIFSSDESLVGTSIDTKKEANIAYKKSLAGEVYVSDVVTSDDTGDPTILFSAPIRDNSSSGRPIIGVAIGQFSWPTIEEILTAAKKKSSYTYLFSEDGRLISTNNTNVDAFGEHIGKFDDLGMSRDVAENKILKKSDGTSELLISQVPQLGYLGYKGNNWNLIIESQADIIFASVYQNARNILFVFTPIILASACLLLFLISTLFITPLKNLTQIVKAITAGDLKKRVEVTSHDEIGELGKAFNAMTDQLLETQANTEKKVEERTKELEELNKVFTGRELKMVEMKEKIKSLEQAHV